MVNYRFRKTYSFYVKPSKILVKLAYNILIIRLMSIASVASVLMFPFSLLMWFVIIPALSFSVSPEFSQLCYLFKRTIIWHSRATQTEILGWDPAMFFNKPYTSDHTQLIIFYYIFLYFIYYVNFSQLLFGFILLIFF